MYTGSFFCCSIVYEPSEQNNEEKSAEVFLRFAEECLNVRYFQSITYNI